MRLMMLRDCPRLADELLARCYQCLLGKTRPFGEALCGVTQMRTSLWTLAILVAGSSACSDLKDVPCETDSNCNLGGGGVCTLSPSGLHWCAYPDSACPAGYRYSDQSVGDGLAGECVDSRSDGGVPDAPRVRAYDVAYPKEWKFSVPGPVSGYFLAINTSVTPLNMNSLVVRSIDDDHPTAAVRVTASAVGSSVPPGAAGGKLTGLAKMVLVDSGLVTEPRADEDTDYLNIELINAPDGTYDIHVDLKLSLDNADFSMPMVIHVVPTGVVYADPLVGDRLTVYR